MALSNLRREPCREITEQLFGVVAFGLLIAGDYWLASSLPHDGNEWPPIWAGMILYPIGVVVGLAVLVMAWYLAHSTGEVICGLMRDIGIDPRPKQRY